MRKNKAIKYITIVTLCAILDMMLHAITSKIIPGPEISNLNSLSKTIGVPLVALVWVFIAYPSVAYVFHRYEDKLSGIKREKGFCYGSLIGFLWLWGVIESSSISGTTLIYETFGGLSDGLPIMLMVVLLGAFTIKRNSLENKNKTINLVNIFPSIFIFTVVFLAGRYLLYVTKFIVSGYEIRPYATFIWTLLMGTFIGIMYVLLGRATKSSSTLLSAIKYGVIIFGINWTIFQLLIPLVFEGALVDIIRRCVSDILWVILSYYLAETFEKYICHKKKQNIIGSINRKDDYDKAYEKHA